MTARRRHGVLVALLDTRFTTFATPVLVSWIYRGCMAVIVMVTLWWMLLAVAVMTWRNGWMWGALGLAAAPLIGFVMLLVVRVALELAVARFRIPAAGTLEAPRTAPHKDVDPGPRPPSG
ncbi:DUF4282 domain-containing protein [Actinomadura terrae]|uniref:DUF4282 domain-containing protein n=1 Tax=Actinomadura terrae TaxID=604353 RepID=UPI001FA7471C|nr:DUF4282 domain-containing protein [Actinomadura terrae]